MDTLGPSKEPQWVTVMCVQGSQQKVVLGLYNEQIILTEILKYCIIAEIPFKFCQIG